MNLVYVIAFLLGCASAIDNPARQAFVNEIVGPDSLHNAIALNSASFNLARLAGPALAGVMVAADRQRLGVHRSTPRPSASRSRRCCSCAPPS